jgi:hypothetical protein
MPEKKHPTVPKEYAGKWIAWDHAMTRIVASGGTPAEVLKAAKEAGEPDPVLGKSPPANARFIAGPGGRAFLMPDSKSPQRSSFNISLSNSNSLGSGFCQHHCGLR